MRNAKSILFLCAVIAVLSFLNLAVRLRPDDPQRLADLSLLSPSADFRRIEICRRCSMPTVLERTSAWKFVAPYDCQVDEQAVLRLLDILTLTQVSDMISSSELIKLGRSAADFSLSEPILTLSVTDAEGKAVTVLFGTPTPAADGVYATVAGLDAVFVVPLEVFAAVDCPADAFRNRSLVRTDAAAVVSFDIRQGTGTTRTFSREGSDWTSHKERASKRMIDAYVAELTSASVVEFVWPTAASNRSERVSESVLAGYGLTPDNAVTVTMREADGSSSQVSFGKTADDGTVYAVVENGGAIATVPTALKDTAVRAKSLFLDSRLFPVDSSSVMRFSIADGPTTCAFSRDVSKIWRLESPIDAPADASVVEEVLKRLSALSVSDATDEEPRVRVSFSTNDSPVSVSRARVLGRLTIDDFRSREVVRVDPDQVRRLVRTVSTSSGSASSSVVYGRDRRLWQVESAEGNAAADAKGIQRVLSAINPLVAVRVAKLKVAAADLAGYGLDRPVCLLSVDLDGEATVRRNILIGDKTSDGRYATVGSSDAVFVLADAVLESLDAPLVR